MFRSRFKIVTTPNELYEVIKAHNITTTPNEVYEVANADNVVTTPNEVYGVRMKTDNSIQPAVYETIS
jgi:hypothetical protein